MTVLVTYASKHDSTREIAEAIGRELQTGGFETEVRDVAVIDAVAPYEAVVLGSAVYAGRWLESARSFVQEHGDDLAARPTWLFSSGPIGDPPRPSDEDAVHIDAIVTATQAREHRVFAGKLAKDQLSFPERAIVFAFRTDEGDFRDWDAIAAWGREIAGALELGGLGGTRLVAGVRWAPRGKDAGSLNT